jgi:hypothetical protein
MNVAVQAQAAAGRNCPLDYGYSAALLDRPAEISADVLYVVGGLYGNLAALDAIETIAASERGPVTLVFNGDFHWFDAAPDWFAEIDARVARHTALRGNVETEIARAGDVGAGCGCAYPASVDDRVVGWSNAISLRLRAALASRPDLSRRLSRLPMHLVAQVGGLRVGIVHGDATSLAGWAFAQDALDRALGDAEGRRTLARLHRAARVDIFASTHTCLPALREFDHGGGRLTVINNGAAGMPNFSGTRFGLLTRIAVQPSPLPPLYGVARSGVHVSAIPIAYSTDEFLGRFLACWPPGSPAHDSYFRRITRGPDYALATAAKP